MKTTELNKINTTQAQEIKAAAEAEAILTEEEILAAVKPEGFLDLLNRVYADEIKMVTDGNQNIIGLNISKATGVNVVKVINGKVIIGATESEAHEDELNQKKFAKAYEGKPVQKWYELCLQLKAGNYKPDEVLETKNGLVFILASSYKAIDEGGHTIITVDVPKGTAKSVVIDLIKAKLAAKEVEELTHDNRILTKQLRDSASCIDGLRNQIENRDRSIRSKDNQINQLNENIHELESRNARLHAQAVQAPTRSIPSNVASVHVEVNDGYCTIVLCENLRTMSLKDAILLAIRDNKNLIAMTRQDNPYVKGAKFIADRIQSNIPIEANSRAELKGKVSKIVYGALKDSETLGFASDNGGQDSNPAMQLSDKIAETIIANAILG